MDYYYEMSKFWKDILIAFIVFHVLIFAIIIVRTYFFYVQNPSDLLKEKFFSKFLWKLLYHFVDTWSEIMFWILFFTTGYWFIVYKL